VRQLLTESLMVALAGGAIGAGVLSLSLKALVLAAPGDIPFLEAVTFDSTVLAFTAAVTLACALLVGLAPALLVSRADVRALLQAARAKVGGSETRLRHALVAAQTGLALVLLVSAGLLVQSFWKLQAVDHGFDPDHILTVSLDLPQARYGSNAAQVAFYNGLLDGLRAVPGVTAAAGTTSAPAAGAGMTFSFAIEGRPSTNPSGREDPMPLQGITPGYFETMRIPVLEGRAIETSDGPDTPWVVVINHALAMTHWPDGGAVGALLRFRENHPWYEVVGVVGDTHDEGLDVPAPPTMYLSLAQRNAAWAWMTWQTLVIRTAGDPMSVVPAVRDTIWKFDSNLPLLDVSTMDAAFAENDARRRFATTLLGAFALLALGLGAIGVFGVLSCAMAERRQEIGIRLALGAAPSHVATTMIRTALAWALAGIALGAAAALAVTRFLQTLLFDVEPTDPLTFAAMTVLLLTVAALAAWCASLRSPRCGRGTLKLTGPEHFQTAIRLLEVSTGPPRSVASTPDEQHGNDAEVIYGAALERHQARAAHSPPVSGVHGRGGPFTRARHRPEHGDLHPGQHALPEPAASRSCVRARRGLHDRREERIPPGEPASGVASELQGLSRQQLGLHGSCGLFLSTSRQRVDRPDSRTGVLRNGVGQLLSGPRRPSIPGTVLRPQ